MDASAAAGRLPLGWAGELSGCVVSGDLPCTLMAANHRRSATITFSLDLRQPPGSSGTLSLSLVLDGETYTVTDDWFEDGVQRLEKVLPAHARLVCCLTCLFSDYSPGRHSLTGIRCHRGAKQ